MLYIINVYRPIEQLLEMRAISEHHYYHYYHYYQRLIKTSKTNSITFSHCLGVSQLCLSVKCLAYLGNKSFTSFIFHGFTGPEY